MELVVMGVVGRAGRGGERTEETWLARQTNEQAITSMQPCREQTVVSAQCTRRPRSVCARDRTVIACPLAVQYEPS